MASGKPLKGGAILIPKKLERSKPGSATVHNIIEYDYYMNVCLIIHDFVCMIIIIMGILLKLMQSHVGLFTNCATKISEMLK